MLTTAEHQTPGPGVSVARFMPLPEASRYSGMSISTLRRLLAESVLTGYRPAGKRVVLLDRQALDAVILSSATAFPPAEASEHAAGRENGHQDAQNAPDAR